MRSIILGAGGTGLQLARRLAEEGKDVVLIEKDPDIVRIAANLLDCLVIQGDGSLPETLERAGTAKAQHFIALTGSDEMNIVTCSVVAAEYPGAKRVARVHNAYFTRLAPQRRTFMGVDRFVNPDIEAARAFISLVSQGADDNFVSFGDEDLVLRSSHLAANSPFVDRSLRESRGSLGVSFLVAALERGSGVEIPSGDSIPEAGDVIYLLGSSKSLDRLIGAAPAPESRFRKIVIAGGGAVGRFVADSFLGKSDSGSLGLSSRLAGILRGRSRDLVILDRDMAVCKELARDLPDALVLNRDLSDEDLFLEEGLCGADLFLALTSNQELNLLSAARAKSFGIDRALALSSNNAYADLAQDLELDGVVSVKSNVVSSIIEYLRGGNLTTLHSFFDRGFKILEFFVAPKSGLDGTAIRDLALPKGALIIFVNRDGRGSLPTGETRLSSGDRLGIFTAMSAIRDVERLFLGEEK